MIRQNTSEQDIADAQVVVERIEEKQRLKAEAHKARWDFYNEQLAKMSAHEMGARKSMQAHVHNKEVQ